MGHTHQICYFYISMITVLPLVRNQVFKVKPTDNVENALQEKSIRNCIKFTNKLAQLVNSLRYTLECIDQSMANKCSNTYGIWDNTLTSPCGSIHLEGNNSGHIWSLKVKFDLQGVPN